MTYLQFLAPEGPTIVNYVREAADETDTLLQQKLYEAEVSLPQLEFLDHLVRLERPAALGELASLLDCARSNVTQLMDRLERRGLVSRAYDPTDRRGVRAALTREGIRRHLAGLAIVVSLERDLRGAFSHDVLRQLLSGLAELRDAASDRSHLHDR